MEPTVPQMRRTPRSTRHARADRVRWWGGLLASVALHALLFLLWRADAGAPGTPAGVERPDVRAGGGAVRAVRVTLPERREIPAPPRPVPAIEVPEMAPARPLEVAFPGPEALPVAAPARLPGLGGGPSSGEGGRGGDGDGYLAPVPRSVLPHWDPPASVRGLEVTVRVFVDETGAPTGLVELDPPTPDDGFNREIRDRVKRMRYRPATRRGTPVAGWAEITFIF